MMDPSPGLHGRARSRGRFGNLACAGLVAWVATGSQTVAQDRPLTADFEEVYRVGGLDAPSWAQFSDRWFGRSLPMGFDGAGNLHVLDPDAAQVVVIDGRGELARIVGREGEGPGEFIRPIDLGVWRDGRFVVMDPGHQAFQVFGPDGGLEHFVKTGRAPIFVRFLATRVAPREDAMIVQGPPPNPARWAIAESVTGTTQEDRADDRGLERLNLRGDVMTVEPVLQAWRMPRKEDEWPGPEDLRNASPADLARMASEIEGMRRFLDPELLWDILPDGTIAYSDSSAYVIKLARAGGPVIDMLRRPLPAEPVTPRIRSAVITEELRIEREYVADIASAEGAPPIAEMLTESRRQIENAKFFAEVPVVRGVRATWDGGLWIQRRGEEPWDDEGPIDVFGADREYVGTFARRVTRGCPPRSGPMVSSPSGSWMSWTCLRLLS